MMILNWFLVMYDEKGTTGKNLSLSLLTMSIEIHNSRVCYIILLSIKAAGHCSRLLILFLCVWQRLFWHNDFIWRNDASEFLQRWSKFFETLILYLSSCLSRCHRFFSNIPLHFIYYDITMLDLSKLKIVLIFFCRSSKISDKNNQSMKVDCKILCWN